MKDLGWSKLGAEWYEQSVQRSHPLANEVHLYSLEFAPWLQLIPQLSEWLSQDEQGRAARLRFADARDRFILSHAYTRSVLACYLGVHPQEVQFKTSSTGKPWIANEGWADLGFNLSHCKTYVVVAVAPTLLVGVDIEEQRPQVDALGIAKRYFTQKEADLLHALPATDTERSFLQLWTCKEAFVKAIGLGLSYSLNRFRIDGLLDENPEFADIEPEYGSAADWSLRTYRPSATSHIAIAVKLPNAIVTTFC